MSESPSAPVSGAENPFVKPDLDMSIVSTILDLDELMSAEPALAERMVTIYTQPALEAQIDDLEEKLVALLGPEGELPARNADASLGDDDAAHAVELAEQIKALQDRYAASARHIRVRQLDSDTWSAFQKKHDKVLKAEPPYPDEMWTELIAASAVEPTLTLDQIRALRKKLGSPTLHLLANACFNLNTEVGVSVPKSRASSHVLRLRRPATS